MILLELFCAVDDFWKKYESTWRTHLLSQGKKRRGKTPRLSSSEVMTILIAFHQSHYRNFKAYYLNHVQVHWRKEFPQLVSYTRFVEFIPQVLVPMIAYAWQCMGTCTGISFVDSTRIVVHHNKRIARNSVFRTTAKRGKTTTGYFYGFKLHLIVNDQGEILSFFLTPGNMDDRKPLPKMVRNIFGKLFGDKGYLSELLYQALYARGITLITPLRKNMRNSLILMEDNLLLRKRSIIETINDQRKNISQREHSRHWSVMHFCVNVISGLIAYCHKEKKPSLDLGRNHLACLSYA